MSARNLSPQVQQAIRAGLLIRQPCCKCGNPKTDAHHEDYSRPLDVIWLCRRHHAMRHLELAPRRYSKHPRHRTSLHLTAPQMAYLRTETVRASISVNQLIRRIIDEYRTGK